MFEDLTGDESEQNNNEQENETNDDDEILTPCLKTPDNEKNLFFSSKFFPENDIVLNEDLERDLFQTEINKEVECLKKY